MLRRRRGLFSEAALEAIAQHHPPLDHPAEYELHKFRPKRSTTREVVGAEIFEFGGIKGNYALGHTNTRPQPEIVHFEISRGLGSVHKNYITNPRLNMKRG